MSVYDRNAGIQLADFFPLLRHPLNDYTFSDSEYPVVHCFLCLRRDETWLGMWGI